MISTRVMVTAFSSILIQFYYAYTANNSSLNLCWLCRLLVSWLWYSSERFIDFKKILSRVWCTQSFTHDFYSKQVIIVEDMDQSNLEFQSSLTGLDNLC
jgi:hypothetical protein